ncbi:hypothetical protein B4U84_28880 [Westiellopsis prolifica IICB1]|nr:hypothetical protein B4U84_28880 [Westiellopsis prolifica IICB1]
MVKVCNQMEKESSTNLVKLSVQKSQVVARRVSEELHCTISWFDMHPRPMRTAMKAHNETLTNTTKYLATNFHTLKQLNLPTTYHSQRFMIMKTHFKQPLLIKKIKNKSNLNLNNNSDATVFLLVQEYCRLSKLLEPSERDIERISAILELAQYDNELNCLINEADHLIAYELGLSEEIEEFNTNFRVSSQEK